MVSCPCCGAACADRRAASGVLGVVDGEAWRQPTVRGRAQNPVTAALTDVAHGYIAHRGADVPLEVARRHDGAPGPAWLLVVAIVHDDIRRLASDTLELAAAADIPRIALGDCVDYVFLAAALFTGYEVDRAIEAATGASAYSPGEPPSLCGETMADALAASVWALTQTTLDGETLDSLANLTTPGVMAAVGGVLGLRRGSTLPRHARPRRRHAGKYAALVPGLLHVRHAAGSNLADAESEATS